MYSPCRSSFSSLISPLVGEPEIRPKPADGKMPWKRHSVENQKQVSHLAWKSCNPRRIPTFPPPRRRVFYLIGCIRTSAPQRSARSRSIDRRDLKLVPKRVAKQAASHLAARPAPCCIRNRVLDLGRVFIAQCPGAATAGVPPCVRARDVALNRELSLEWACPRNPWKYPLTSIPALGSLCT